MLCCVYNVVVVECCVEGMVCKGSDCCDVGVGSRASEKKDGRNIYILKSLGTTALTSILGPTGIKGWAMVQVLANIRPRNGIARFGEGGAL